MAERNYGGEGYLSTIGRELLPEIDVFWTGPEIISREITVAHVRELRDILRRKPLIWDNFWANDGGDPIFGRILLAQVRSQHAPAGRK